MERTNQIWIFISLIIFSSCGALNSKNNNLIVQNSFRQAAEYEPMDAVWMLWPQVTHKKSEPIPPVIISIIKSLAPYCKIKLVVPNDSIYKIAISQLPDSIIKNKTVTFLRFPYREFWTRDFGPAFLINDSGQKAIADFMFDDWGYNDTSNEAARLDEKFDERVADHYHIPVISSNLITEGGDHEINSKGTLLLVKAVEQDRNPHLQIQEIENEFKRMLGAKKIIWLEKGVRDDDKSTFGTIDGPAQKKYYTVLTTNGHVDEFARFVNDSTIILADVDQTDRNSPLEKETGSRMDENYRILNSSTDQDGKPFHILRMPMPYPVTNTMVPGDGVYDILSDFSYTDSSKFPKGKMINVVAAASYLNFLIANKVVLMAKYWRKGSNIKIKERDDLAFSILQKAFPDKKIIQIDALAVNLGGGGMHCITINEPTAKTIR